MLERIVKHARELMNKCNSLLFKFKYKSIIYLDDALIKSTRIQQFGCENKIILAKAASLNKCHFYIKGNHNVIYIGEGTQITGVTFWLEDNNNLIHIGKKCTFENNTQLAACEGTQIIIGDDCMFSNSISVRTTDSHSILNNDGIRLNKALDVSIGNHVWVGYQTLILKGAKIADNSVVGARSVVSSVSPHVENCIIAGHPSRIIRRDIKWLRQRI